LYALANKYKKQALNVNTVSDHLNGTHTNMTSSQRQTSFARMIESVLEI
jgi:purine-nucleoside phosphorylase